MEDQEKHARRSQAPAATATSSSTSVFTLPTSYGETLTRVSHSGSGSGSGYPGSKQSQSSASAHKSKKTDSVRQEISTLREQLEADNSDTTPTAGESLRVFYARTAVYWGEAAVVQFRLANKTPTEKEVKREGFVLAEARYNALAPLLSRINELEAQQQDNELAAGPGVGQLYPGKNCRWKCINSLNIFIYCVCNVG